MAKIPVKNNKVEAPTNPKAELPTITDEIFKLKIDRETQKFFIDGMEKYGKFDEVTLRPLDLLTKIVAYDESFDVKSESTLYRELKEARDSQGNTAVDKPIAKVCGRIIWKNQTEKLSEDEKTENASKAKFYAMLFAIATVQGKEPVLVDFRIGGSKFMEVINLLKKIKEEKTEYNRAEIRVKAFPSQEFDWPELEFMPDFSRELPLAGLEELFDTVEGFIEYHNEGVNKKAKQYLDRKAGRGTNTGFKSKSSFKRK